MRAVCQVKGQGAIVKNRAGGALLVSREQSVQATGVDIYAFQGLGGARG